MQILLYEYTTGGGLLAEADTSEFRALLQEGTAMISALVADFAAAEKCKVSVLRDARLVDLRFPGCELLNAAAAGDDERLLKEYARQADWTLVIAPETSGILVGRCRTVIEAGGRLLGPSPQFIELASDKQLTAERLSAAGVAVPLGCAIAAGTRLPPEFAYPAVLKPRDGCGSQDVRLIPDHLAAAQIAPLPVASRLERYCRGLPASVAFLCGPGVCLPLPACQQRLSTDGSFAYQGGSLPLSPHFAARAQSLAMRTMATLPEACGYVGIDLVLGESADGSEDFVIEVNPRLTTSYIGLRAACRNNLAEAMLAAASSATRHLRFCTTNVQFAADGCTTC